jgi:RNA polymerase sigma-70 factor (ECF subfamily)
VNDAGGADELVETCIIRALAMVEAGTFRAESDLRVCLFGLLRRASRHNNGGTRESEARQLSPPRSEMATSSASSVRQNGELFVSSVEKAFLGLSIELREILLLIVIEGMTYEKAADVIGVSVGTVKSRLARARGELEAALGDFDSRCGAI